MNNFILGFAVAWLIIIANLRCYDWVTGYYSNKVNAGLLDAVTSQIITVEQERKLEELFAR